MKSVVLGGGGSAERRRWCLRTSHHWFRVAGTFSAFPGAQLDPTHPELHQWIESALGQFGLTDIVTVQTVNDDVCDYIESFDAVFMGGGNTYRLLHRIRETGVGAALVRLNDAGLPVYGGSAGAIVLGVDIGTCAHLDRNDSEVSDLHGLDRCGGAAIWCHYVEADD
jgi:dipeptidase E